jgi:sulfatase maturation enzyme AslB (radical SAM superfamily)
MFWSTPFSELRFIIDMIALASSNVSLSITGGEASWWEDKSEGKTIVDLVKHAKARGFNRIDLSTNASAPSAFNISLDDHSEEYCREVYRYSEQTHRLVIENIKRLSRQSNVTLHTVLTQFNFPKFSEFVEFVSANTAVKDIKILASRGTWREEFRTIAVDDSLLQKYTLLKKRIGIIKSGRNIFGIPDAYDGPCPQRLTFAFANGYYYPCLIYQRENGEPIGRVDYRNDIRDELQKIISDYGKWLCHDHADISRTAICKRDCYIANYINHVDAAKG